MCFSVGRRAAFLDPEKAAAAWKILAEHLEAMGEMDVPKFRDLVKAIRDANIAAKREGKIWRCFHCDEVFTDPKEAVTHFGSVQGAVAVCAIKADEIRHMEWCLSKYREEDTELHRQIRRMESEHQIALRRVEESGYSKGLNDGRQLSA